MTVAKVLVVASALAAIGCHNYLFSPPARMLPLESAATLPPGDTGIQVEGGEHGAWFGFQAASGTLRAGA